MRFLPEDSGFLHRNDNFVYNRGDGKWTAPPSISHPVKPYNTCHSDEVRNLMPLLLILWLI